MSLIRSARTNDDLLLLNGRLLSFRLLGESQMTSLLGKLKRGANYALKWTGHQIDFEGHFPSFGRLVGHLDRAGLTPKTVVDIGVASGTPWLYDAYPHAKYFLFDPTPQSMPHMQAIAQRLDAQVFNIALGDTEGSVRLKIRPHHSDSTIFEEVGQTDVVEEREVPVARFDKVMPAFQRPAFAKIDVQGAEIMVIKGMGDRLREIDCLLVETSTIATIRGGPEFAELVSSMHEAGGFVLFDVTGLLRRPLDNALAQMDVAFVPENSPVRSDHRWAS